MKHRRTRKKVGMQGNLLSVIPAVMIVLLLTVQNTQVPPDATKDRSTLDLSDLNTVQIDTVYGTRRAYTDLEYNYRVRVKDGATWPIKYNWTIDEDLQTAGNNIVHQFKRPGKFPIDVVVSNEYGEDTARIWVYVIDRTIVRPPVADVESTPESNDAVPDIKSVAVQLVPSDVPVEGTYFSWAVETYLSRLSAQSALSHYVDMGLPNVRVYEDDAGSGSTAFRVLVGKYVTQQKAIKGKEKLESLVERPVSLITIRG